MLLLLQGEGGSLEDLWPFNEEIVAYSIYHSKIPIISAVGHETDFTIADFVADLRAPTPSAAAELAVGNREEIIAKLDNYVKRLKISLKRKTELMRLRYEKCMASRVYTNPLQRVNENYIKIDMQVKKLQNSMTNQLIQSKNDYAKLVAKLDTLSPLKTLSRGFCLAEVNGKIVKQSKDLQIGDILSLKFQDGEQKAKVI